MNRVPTPDELAQMRDDKKHALTLQKIMEQQLMQSLPPETFRIVAKFNQSNYDIEISTIEGIETIQNILDKYKQYLTNRYKH